MEKKYNVFIDDFMNYKINNELVKAMEKFMGKTKFYQFKKKKRIKAEYERALCRLTCAKRNIYLKSGVFSYADIISILKDISEIYVRGYAFDIPDPLEEYESRIEKIEIVTDEGGVISLYDMFYENKSPSSKSMTSYEIYRTLSDHEVPLSELKNINEGDIIFDMKKCKQGGIESKFFESILRYLERKFEE